MPDELILLVDDEPHIIQLAEMYLHREGYKTVSAKDGPQALDKASRDKPDLMVLDIMLPGLDGFEVCRRLRAQDNQIPIIMLTARDDDIDKIVGLEMGADDYLTKPFNPRELVARVKAIIRRSDRASQAIPGDVVRVGGLQIDTARREVIIDDNSIELRTQEFELLTVFARHRGIVMRREQLLQHAWGYDFYGQTRTVDVHVAQLRKKLNGTSIQIMTVTGIGYKLVVD